MVSVSRQFESTTAQWHHLVSQAQFNLNVNLGEELESYLVFLLIRCTQQFDVVDSVIALEFLNASQKSKRLSAENLQKIGDQCLLLSGLFPNRALKRHVKISYFVNIGRTAYDLRSECFYKPEPLFHNLSYKFINLVDVLHTMHGIDNPQASDLLLPLQAFELWSETESESAKRIIDNATSNPCIIQKTPSNKH